MKNIIVLTLLIFASISVHSQTDSLFLKSYDQKIKENSKLESDLQTEKEKNFDLNGSYKRDTIALQKQIKDLRNELTSEKQKVLDLNQDKNKIERDILVLKIDSLNRLLVKQNVTISEKDLQILNEKTNAKIAADNAKNQGKAEAIAILVNFYRNRLFDDLIESSSKGSVARDMQIVGSNPEINPILSDLSIYYNALELLTKKIDAAQIKNSQTQLGQIKRQSKLLDILKDDVEFYQDFNSGLKETIMKLVHLDKVKSAGGVSETQKLKFNEILTILGDYIYNYYDYPKYPYLSDVVIEIIKRKQPNADADITDLLIKL